jgi:hypothetical protein
MDEVLTQRLSEAAGTAVSASPRARITRPPGVEALELPGGSRLPLTADTLAAPDGPGVYFFLRGEARVGALVVNPEPEESALARLDDATLVSRLRARDVRTVRDSAQLSSALFASAPRRPVVLPLLIVALAALLVESAVAGVGHKRAG